MNYSQIMSPRSPLPRKVGGVMTPQLLWERRPCVCKRSTSLLHVSLLVVVFEIVPIFSGRRAHSVVGVKTAVELRFAPFSQI